MYYLFVTILSLSSIIVHLTHGPQYPKKLTEQCLVVWWYDNKPNTEFIVHEKRRHIAQD